MSGRMRIVAAALAAAVLTAGVGTAAWAMAGSGGRWGPSQRMGSEMWGSSTHDADMGPGMMNDAEAGQRGAMGMMAGVSVDSEFGYLTQMIPHHQEAIAAARQLLARSARPQMRAFATSIISTQSAQVDQMTQELARWYPGRDTTVDYTPMMRDLSGLSGDALDRAFLEDMLPHHGLAVMLSQQLLGRGLAEHAEVTALATSIRDGQRAEMITMMGWLGSWFGEGMHVSR